jgi:transcriptional regulator with XRE-family HTH domain
VLITKLRRLLPIRIEAQWGQGYVVDGIPASQSDEASSEGEPGGCHQGISGTPLMRESAIVVRPAAAPQKSQTIGRRCGLAETSLRNWERGVAAPPPDARERWAGALGFRIALLPVDAGSRRGIWVDWQQQRITVDDVPVRLTPMEWRLLERLSWSPGQLVTHKELFKHLYGKERDCRAQATAVRVLINKLRRLLPIRIEAQWGQGYVVGGIPASRSDGPDETSSQGEHGGCHQRTTGTPLMREPAILVRPVAAPSKPQPIGRRMIATKQTAARPAMALAITSSRCRSEELGVIERFLAERGATRCPDPQTVAQSGQSELVWDKMKRKWVRSTTPLSMQMPAGH